jgi:hypothetical protein
MGYGDLLDRYVVCFSRRYQIKRDYISLDVSYIWVGDSFGADS